MRITAASASASSSPPLRLLVVVVIAVLALTTSGAVVSAASGGLRDGALEWEEDLEALASMKDADDSIPRDLATGKTTCPTFTCSPTIHFSTLPQAKAPGGAEINFYGSVPPDTTVCWVPDLTVLQLANYGPCAYLIYSVTFTLFLGTTKIRVFTELLEPYTVFGDDLTKGTFNAKALVPGTYTITTTIRYSNGCKLWSSTHTFDVAMCSTDAPTPTPSTDFPTLPPVPVPTILRE